MLFTEARIESLLYTFVYFILIILIFYLFHL